VQQGLKAVENGLEVRASLVLPVRSNHSRKGMLARSASRRRGTHVGSSAGLSRGRASAGSPATAAFPDLSVVCVSTVASSGVVYVTSAGGGEHGV
jgi:hypothetical protein